MANLPSLFPIVAKETAAVQTAGLCCKLLLMRVHAPPLKVSVEGAAPLIRLYLSSFYCTAPHFLSGDYARFIAP